MVKEKSGWTGTFTQTDAQCNLALRPTIHSREWSGRKISSTSDPSRKRPNHCDHLTATSRNLPISVTCWPTRNTWGETFNQAMWVTARTGYVGIGPIEPPMPLYGEIEQRFKGTTKAPQLLNFLAEVASLRALAQGIVSLGKTTIAKNGSFLKRAFVHDQGTPQALAQASSGYLGYNFGIAASVKDAIASVKQAANLGNQLADLIGSQGKPVKMTWSSKSSGHLSEITGEQNYCRGRIEYEWTSKSSRFITASYTLHPSQVKQLNDLNYFISGLGLDNFVSSAWEAIPLSFVVDWFLPIGRQLAAIEPDLWDFASFNVLDHYYQCKVEGKFRGVIISDGYFRSGSPLIGKTYCTGEFKNFFRRPVYDPIRVTNLALGGGLSATQGVTSAALGAQRGITISGRK